MTEQQCDEMVACITAFQARFPLEGISRQLVLRNRYVFHTGNPAQGVYLMIDGLVKVSKVSSAGNEKILHVAARGDFLAEVPVLLNRAYDTTAQAVSDALMFYIPERTISELLHESPLLCRQLLGGMVRKVHCLIQDIESNFKAGHERVADFLLAQAEDMSPHDAALSVALPIKKIDLASWLGLTPQHFSRILQDLRQKGLIVVDGPVIHIPSVENLRNGWLRFGKDESILQAAH
ncbi:Crp/Fnr family transcriptional regulator [Ferribacterium limneticum]|uniref:Crp/Fnr family transcriptional regulator n=1 Tax=Ferribacterium limneticum TaxID=76259 RepID=UPI001CF92F95|nr:Crp/Fnr family transcriptional regulator [Ferribacterium limneticum]UCV27729.1 Crp/Fnr family transcriptional regulator [Ferribacterium limneticum]UCV31646.1 Crp/Fnr family transcriptional regulator [Ferribacterium limneticum]